MYIQYRVRAYPPNGEDVILEQFEARSDAEACFSALREGDDSSILDSLPFDSVVVSLEEFVNGQWTNVRKVLADLR